MRLLPCAGHADRRLVWRRSTHFVTEEKRQGTEILGAQSFGFVLFGSFVVFGKQLILTRFVDIWLSLWTSFLFCFYERVESGERFTSLVFQHSPLQFCDRNTIEIGECYR